MSSLRAEKRMTLVWAVRRGGRKVTLSPSGAPKAHYSSQVVALRVYHSTAHRAAQCLLAGADVQGARRQVLPPQEGAVAAQRGRPCRGSSRQTKKTPAMELEQEQGRGPQRQRSKRMTTIAALRMRRPAGRPRLSHPLQLQQQQDHRELEPVARQQAAPAGPHCCERMSTRARTR